MSIGYKYRPGRGIKDENGQDIFERDIVSFSNNEIYVPTLCQLNDPTETFYNDHVFNEQIRLLGRKFHVSANRVLSSFNSVKDKIRKVGVYSLSKNNNNELMWAYYANGHNGYEIIFDTDYILSSMNINNQYRIIYELDVTYKSELPKIDMSYLNQIGPLKMLHAFLGSKSKAWKHEDEYRLVFDNLNGLVMIDYRAIKGFIFGCRFPPEDVEYVMNHFKGRKLEYYQASFINNKYELRLKQIEDSYKDASLYIPNHVEYSLAKLLDEDKNYYGCASEYIGYVQKAINEVCKNCFVTDIFLLTTHVDEPNLLSINISTHYKHPSLPQPVRVFKFIVELDTGNMKQKKDE